MAPPAMVCNKDQYNLKHFRLLALLQLGNDESNVMLKSNYHKLNDKIKFDNFFLYFYEAAMIVLFRIERYLTNITTAKS